MTNVNNGAGGSSQLSLPIIVVIDDNPCDVFLLRYSLATLGNTAEIRWFADSAAALAYMRENPRVNLIICDFWLRQNTGLEIVKQLQCEAGMREICAMLLSGVIPPHYRETAEQMGIACLQKPMSLEGWSELAEYILHAVQPESRRSLRAAA